MSALCLLSGKLLQDTLLFLYDENSSTLKLFEILKYMSTKKAEKI